MAGLLLKLAAREGRQLGTVHTFVVLDRDGEERDAVVRGVPLVDQIQGPARGGQGPEAGWRCSSSRYASRTCARRKVRAMGTSSSPSATKRASCASRSALAMA